MDSNWHVKCGSSLQPPAPSMASSASQEHRNQMDMNSGQYFYPNGTQDLRSTLHDSLSPNGSHLSFQKTNHSELGNSYLTLLSGPPSQLHYDFQELSNAKALSISRSANVNALESRVSQTSSGLLSGTWINQNMQDGVHLSPAVPSKSLFNSISSTLILPDSLQATHFNLQTSDLAKAVIHHLVPVDKKEKDLSSNQGEWCGTTSANTRNLHGKTVLKSSKIPLEAKSSSSNQSPAVLSGCPRVFCLGTSGFLLLSNTGLVGIVCSCHFLHMSVSKFCEHSGLCDMNPGDAVRIESGETIAHWRKRYFEKFGIRVPEDPSGWDWPEGLFVTAGLAKSNAAMHKISDNSDLDNLVASPQGLAMCGENISCLKNPHTDQNLSIDPLHNKQQRNVDDGNNFLPKGLISTSQSNLRAVADNQRVEYAVSKSSSASKFVGRGPDNGSHSISAWIDTILKTGNPCLTHPSLQNLKALGQSCVVNTAKIAQDGVIADNKSASSNIELRLGQPYQQSQSLRNYALPISEPKPLEILADPPKSCYPAQKIHHAISCSEREESRMYFHRASGSSNSAARGEQSQWNFGNPAFDVSNTRDATKVRNFEVDVAKGSVIPPFTHLPLEKGVCSKGTSSIVGISESVMPRTLYCESNAPKASPINVLRSSGSTSQRQLNGPELGFLRLIDKNKGTGYVSDGSCVATEPAVTIQKQIESPTVITGAVGGSSSHSFPAAHVKNHFSYQSSNVVTDTYGARNLFNHPVNSPFLGSRGHTGHAIRSMGSSMGSSQISQSSAASTGFPFSTLTPMPDLPSTIPKQGGFNVGPNLLDDSMRLLALKQILELSKQHPISSIGINHEPGRYCCSSTLNVQHSALDLSASGEQRQGPGPISPSKLDVSRGSLMSYPSQKSAQVTGLNNWCNLSTMTQGFPLCSREIEVPCYFSNEPFSNMQPTLSLGRSESLSQSSDHVKCCQRAPSTYFLRNCSCAAQAKCSEYSESRVGHSPVTPKEKLKGFCHEASVLVSASEFVRDHIVSKERTMSMDKRGKLVGELPRSQCCHISQWRDVPRKKKEDCDTTCMGWSEKGAQNVTNDSSADELEKSRNAEGQLGDTAAKRFIGSLKISDSLNRHEMSNISSGCSAPAVTQASFEVNNMDSSTVYAGETGNANNLIVDEGSAIDKYCSSDDALESERSADSFGVSCKSNLKKRKVLNMQSSRSLLDELKLIDSLTWKKGRNQIPMGPTNCGKSDHLKEFGIGLKAGKRKKFMKLKMIDADLPSGQDRQASVSCSLRTGLLSSTKELPHKRALHRLYSDSEEDTCQAKVDAYAKSGNILEVSVRKKLKRARASESVKKHETDEPIHKVAEKISDVNSVCCEKAFLSHAVAFCHRKAKPVVCGKYGEICGGELGGDELKPAKIVPLSRILKIAKRIDKKKSCKAKLMKRRTPGNTECVDLSSDLKKEEKCGSNHSSVFHGVNQLVVDEVTEACMGVLKQSDVKSSMWEKERADKSEKNKTAYAQSSHNCKEIRRRSLYELTVKGKKSHSPLIKIPQCMPRAKVRNSLKKAEDSKCGSCKINAEKNIGEPRFCSDANSDATCFVCGSSNEDEINCLLECSQCSIMVHQACYGVSKVPKDNWYCRPCRAGARNMACVLCGYEGGAMTQALRSRTIVKTLLKEWNIEAECRTKNTPSVKTMLDHESLPHLSSAVLDDSYCISRHGNIESSGSVVWKMDLQNKLDIIRNSSTCVSKFKVHNSITAGVLDSTVKQWVHMVCGLWTPGTRCPNVDTMSAFDVSDVSSLRENEVCSICNRPGGTCIQCRVKSCSVKFHPWCAHQKGLLQSEVEGVDNENVGFYGRCISHATCHTCESGGDQSDAETICPVERELTCARTGGFKGRKQDGFLHSIHDQLKRKSGCFVPQEQLNAWVHINGQKSCIQGLSKRTTSDIEYDCRKEYARYKQSKGGKHLVVYKSGIHALGLYTSRFISRGEMVVEYVGEIVGIRVADKRESEYMSGRKVQYKSACYFFRIDKEHIIDATRKGGIARFVNHSCLPNCVAKVISVRNEKKVVFFAERDIYPGEEITYDYHFNHEDEGKKIPCFCNSKNCRLYLN